MKPAIVTLALALAGIFGFGADCKAAEGLPLNVGNRAGGEPTEEDLVRFAKTFCSRMRTQGDRNAFRDFFDPRYLAMHGLTDRALRSQGMEVFIGSKMLTTSERSFAS